VGHFDITWKPIALESMYQPNQLPMAFAHKEIEAMCAREIGDQQPKLLIGAGAQQRASWGRTRSGRRLSGCQCVNAPWPKAWKRHGMALLLRLCKTGWKRLVLRTQGPRAAPRHHARQHIRIQQRSNHAKMPAGCSNAGMLRGFLSPTKPKQQNRTEVSLAVFVRGGLVVRGWVGAPEAKGPAAAQHQARAPVGVAQLPQECQPVLQRQV
jgi:hypothetical protein